MGARCRGGAHAGDALFLVFFGVVPPPGPPASGGRDNCGGNRARMGRLLGVPADCR